MQTTLPALLLIPIFFTVESTRAALWTARTLEEPDRDGPLLRALFALLVGVLSVVPSPVWTLLTCLAWVAWIPVRGILWLWGIGRGGVKKRSPSAVTRWYGRRRQRAKMRRLRTDDDEDSVNERYQMYHSKAVLE